MFSSIFKMRSRILHEIKTKSFKPHDLSVKTKRKSTNELSATSKTNQNNSKNTNKPSTKTSTAASPLSKANSINNNTNAPNSKPKSNNSKKNLKRPRLYSKLLWPIFRPPKLR